MKRQLGTQNHIFSVKRDRIISKTQAKIDSFMSSMSPGKRRNQNATDPDGTAMPPPTRSRSASEHGQRSRVKAKAAKSHPTELSEETHWRHNSPVRKLASSKSQENFRNFKDSADLLLKQVVEVRSALSSSLNQVEDLTDQLRGAFEGRMDMVSELEDTWQEEKEKKEKISSQRVVIGDLTTQIKENGEKHKEEVARLKEKINSLHVAKEDLETIYRNQSAVLEKDLKSKHTKALGDLRAERARIKQDLEGKYKQTISELESENEQLEKKVTGLEKRVEKLEDSNDMLDGAYKNARKEIKSLKFELDQVQRQFWVEEGHDKDFETRFANIQSRASKMCSKHFRELPESASKNYDSTTRYLREKALAFTNTPISPSDVSVGLRLANVQYIVMRTICDRIWKPMFCEDLGGNVEAQSFLREVSKILAKRGFKQESIWRSMTMEAADAFKVPGRRMAFVGNLADEVLESLQPLLSEPSGTLRDDMKDLFNAAIELWNDVQKDRSRIIIATKPDPRDTQGWKEALPSYLSGEDLPFPSPSTVKESQPLLIFPKVIRISERKVLPDSASPETFNSSASPPRVLHMGHALFADTNIFGIGAKEEDDIREMIMQAPLLVNRRNSAATTFPQPSFEMVEKPKEGS